ncbi:MAG: hypothetical protein OEY86_18730 [Nitrospira sp.]|nr:hypothetical protein [Nitrospira sp.]
MAKHLIPQQSPKIKKNATARKPITINIEIDNSGNERFSLPPTRTAPKYVFSVLSLGNLFAATAATEKADDALSQGRIEDFIDHFNSAARSLGAAVAMAGVNKVTSYIAAQKANVSHEARGTHAVKKEVLDCYRNIVDQPKSAAKAANKVYDLYLLKHGETIDYRTIYELILDDRKKNARPSQALNPPKIGGISLEIS